MIYEKERIRQKDREIFKKETWNIKSAMLNRENENSRNVWKLLEMCANLRNLVLVNFLNWRTFLLLLLIWGTLMLFSVYIINWQWLFQFWLHSHTSLWMTEAWWDWRYNRYTTVWQIRYLFFTWCYTHWITISHQFGS